MPNPTNIDVSLVSQLIATQFPQWAHLAIRPVELSGTDNRTFHLGDDMSVRLPSAGGYAAQVDKEHRWLPTLAPRLPLPIPVPVAMGRPTVDYPWTWSVYRWLDGQNAGLDTIDDMNEFAATLAGFLTSLHQIDATDGPPPGEHNFYRGAPVQIYETDARTAIDELGDQIDASVAADVWDAAVGAAFDGSPVWIHGDVSAGNLLVRDGRLSAVIDFGCSAVGDPACDLVIAWTLLSGESRETFRRTLAADAGTWARGRGWALWKGVITVAGRMGSDEVAMAAARRVVDDVIAEHIALARDAHNESKPG